MVDETAERFLRACEKAVVACGPQPRRQSPRGDEVEGRSGLFMSGMKFVAVGFAIGFTGLALAACANDPSVGPNQGAGAGFGALTGALVGSTLGTNTGSRVAGAIAGAAVGGILGGAVGASLDEQDKQRAYAAQMQAVQYGDPGAPVSWHGADSGRYGTIVPGPAYQSNGTTCREYSHTIYIDRKPQTARGTACRNPDGSWTPVS
jgi:surface antigen